METILFTLPWVVILGAIIYALSTSPRKKFKKRITAPAKKSHITRVHILESSGQAYKHRSATILFQKTDDYNLEATQEERLTEITNDQGIAVFQHRIVGVGELFLDFDHNEVKFGVPNDVAFRVGKKGEETTEIGRTHLYG